MEMDTSDSNHADLPSPDEETEVLEDENQNLLRRAGSVKEKSSLCVPASSRLRSSSSPLSPGVLITVSGACEHVRRLSDCSRISYKTFDWDSAKMSTEEAETARMENIISASCTVGDYSQNGESGLSSTEVKGYVAEMMRECAGAQDISINNSAQQTAEDRRRNFQHMKSLITSESIEIEVKQRQERWSCAELDSPDSSAPRNGIPYTILHEKPAPFVAKSRRIFIPTSPVNVKIADCGRVHSTLHLNPNLYYIEVTHGRCVWTVRRRYNHFLKLHEEMILYKASLHIPVGRGSHRARYLAFRELADDVNDLPHFPRTLDALIRSHQLAKRMLQLEKYLQGVVNNPLYRNHPKILEFLEISHMSFVDELGEKGKEGWVMKRSGGHRVQLGCCSALSCDLKAHYSKRWLLVKDSFVAYVRPKDGHLRAVLLMDQDFQTVCGREDTGLSHGLKITNTYRNLLVRLNHKTLARDWATDIGRTAQRCEYTFDNPHGSFAPPRDDTQVQGFADGADYFESIANAMEKAEQQIFILDWCLNPMVYLKRPAVQGNRWRLDCVLQRKAKQGVKVFVLLYKEVEMALSLGSQHTKQTLQALHPNIKVMRHPDHIPGGAGVMLWAHHEKAVVVDQRVAFMGGIDLCYGRWDDHRHRLTDTGSLFNTQQLASEDSPTHKLPASRRSPDTGVDHSSPGRTLTGVEKRMRKLGIEEGAPRLWIGKDYCNFIVKDVTQPELAFEENVDRTKVPRMPWHDIATVMYGKAALDIGRHFIQRWNFTKEQKSKELQEVPLLLPKSASAISNDAHPVNPHTTGCRCQILRSASEWSVGMKKTEDSIQQAYITAITNSKHYIYIENQFFISIASDPDVLNGIADAIFERIVRAHRSGETFRVYVLMPLLPCFEGEVGGATGGAIHAVLHWEYRTISKGENSLLQRLRQEGISQTEDYISFFGLRCHDVLSGSLVTELIYIHCKLMVVDDRLVIVGSANINDRSMLGYRDSELAVLIEDTEMVASVMNGQHYSAGRFALQFRQQLFREHLGVLNGEGDLDVSDPASDEFYNKTWRRLAYMNTRIYDEVFKCVPTNQTTTIASLQHYRQAPSLAKTNPEAATKRLRQVKGHLVDIPLHFLSEENLQPSIATSEGIAPTKLWT